MELDSPTSPFLLLPHALTPSLPQHVQFPSCRKDARTRQQTVYFRSYNTYTITAMRFDQNLSHASAKKKKKKKKTFQKVSNFALLWFVFKWHHRSERVKSSLRHPVLKLKATFWPMVWLAETRSSKNCSTGFPCRLLRKFASCRFPLRQRQVERLILPLRGA